MNVGSTLTMIIAVIVSSHVVAGNVCQHTNIADRTAVGGSVVKYITSPAVPDTALLLVAARNSTNTFAKTTFTVVRQTITSGVLHFEPMCFVSFVSSVAPPFSLAADGSASTLHDASIDGSQIRVLRLPTTGSVGSVPLCSAVGTLGPILSGAVWDRDDALLSSAFTPPASNDSLVALSLVRRHGTQLNNIECITITRGSSAVTQNCLSSVVSFGIDSLRSFTAVSESEYFAATVDRFVLITRTASATPHLTDAFVTVLGGKRRAGFTSVHSATVTSANRGLLGLSAEWVGSVVVVMPARSPGCGAQVIIPSSGVNASWLSVNISDAVLPDSVSAELTDLCAAGAIDVAVMSGGLQFVSLEGEARTLYVTPSCAAGGASSGAAKSSSSPNEAIIAAVAVCVVVIVVVIVVVGIMVLRDGNADDADGIEMARRDRPSTPPQPASRDDDETMVKLSCLVVDMYFTDRNGVRLAVEEERSIASQPAEPEMNALGDDQVVGTASPDHPQDRESVLGNNMGTASTGDNNAPRSGTEARQPPGDALNSDLSASFVSSQQSHAPVPPQHVAAAHEPNGVVAPGRFNSKASNKILVVQHPPDTSLEFVLRHDSRLGRGGQGEVFLATNKDGGKAYAVKILQSRSVWSRVEKVAKALHEHPHVNVIRPVAAGRTQIGVVMLMELALESLKQRADAECYQNYHVTATYVSGVLRGLNHIHGLGLVHNDLKPQNVLVAPNGVVKLTDFDLSTTAEELVGSRRGTPRYIAPESLKVDANCSVVRHPSFDIWAVGVMVWEMLSESQFLANSQTDAMVAFLCDLTSFDDLARDVPHSLSQDEAALDFVRQCLNPEPSQRPTAEELLNHPFIVRDENSH